LRVAQSKCAVYRPARFMGSTATVLSIVSRTTHLAIERDACFDMFELAIGAGARERGSV
jgi:hypothetical protein